MANENDDTQNGNRFETEINEASAKIRKGDPVDVQVTRPIGETFTNQDSQLQTAVRELLGQIGK